VGFRPYIRRAPERSATPMGNLEKLPMPGWHLIKYWESDKIKRRKKEKIKIKEEENVMK
jgi:hypothetical protein